MGEDEEKSQLPVIYNQPLHQPHPMAVPATTHPLEQASRKKSRNRSFSSGRSGSAGRKRFWSSATSSTPPRRLQISAPSDFRHVSSAAPQMLDEDPMPRPPRTHRDARPRRRSFRPLELSIYVPENHISPILPHFEFPVMVPPPPAYTRERPEDEHALTHQRSYSSMSFHLPRKPVYDSSPSTIQEELPPVIPPKALARGRAYTSPDVDTIKERVASAMIEVERLQRQIDDVIERQSLYASSRPSTAHSMAHTLPGESTHVLSPASCILTHTDLEPMPSIPALPPMAPSFAERLNSDIERPHTAPIKAPAHNPSQTKSLNEVSATFNSASRMRGNDRPLPPPLPLVLRPPLRKKKSFSRVSNWLFTESGHNRDLSVDSVTNLPRPVKDNEGFYQCISPGETSGHRQSLDSVGTVTTWNTEDEDRTVPTSWTPGSTPAAKQDERPIISKNTKLGRNITRPTRTSVGVAF